MGYRPNVVAKALATHRKPTVIGVIINSEGNLFLTMFWRELMRQSRKFSILV
jgi:DNA-binding LacI/PurR family transcriptional regulator